MSDLIDLALSEDIGAGDVTVRNFTDSERRSQARIIAKQPGVLAGIATAAEVFRRVDERLRVEIVAQDGTALTLGDEVLRVAGPTGSILTAERTALNFLQRLSGVATQTRRYVEAIAGTGARLLDTRKTTPGFRDLEKAAVKAGGGTNHRHGLHGSLGPTRTIATPEGARSNPRPLGVPAPIAVPQGGDRLDR